MLLKCVFKKLRKVIDANGAGVSLANRVGCFHQELFQQAKPAVVSRSLQRVTGADDTKGLHTF